jgi:hypothetical protein
MPKQITREEVKKFVKENLVAADDKRTVCADGRYEREQSRGGRRVFGADFGIAMAIAAALKDDGTYLSPEEIVERLWRAKCRVVGERTKLNYHTDSHNRGLDKIGCGHIAKAANPEYDGLYGSITYQEIQALYTSFSRHPEAELTVLEGDHAEKAVLLVHGTSHSVHSRDKKGRMYFVADVDRTDRFIDEIVPFFCDGLLSPISADKVKQNYHRQMQATAGLIAQGLAQFRVTIDDKTGNFSMNQLPNPKPGPQA